MRVKICFFWYIIVPWATSLHGRGSEESFAVSCAWCFQLLYTAWGWWSDSGLRWLGFWRSTTILLCYNSFSAIIPSALGREWNDLYQCQTNPTIRSPASPCTEVEWRWSAREIVSEAMHERERESALVVALILSKATENVKLSCHNIWIFVLLKISWMKTQPYQIS